MTIVEEEFAFRKLKPLLEIQVGNGIKVGSDDKTNDKPYAEIVDVIALVIVYRNTWLGNTIIIFIIKQIC